MMNFDVNSGFCFFKNHEKIGKVYIAFTGSTLEKRSMILKNTHKKMSCLTFQQYFQVDRSLVVTRQTRDDLAVVGQGSRLQAAHCVFKRLSKNDHYE